MREWTRFCSPRSANSTTTRTGTATLDTAGFGTRRLDAPPLLLVPLTLEQTMLARAMATFGAALYAAPEEPQILCDRLEEMMHSSVQARAAKQLAAHYAGFDPIREYDEIASEVERLM